MGHFHLYVMRRSCEGSVITEKGGMALDNQQHMKWGGVTYNLLLQLGPVSATGGCCV